MTTFNSPPGQLAQLFHKVGKLDIKQFSTLDDVRTCRLSEKRIWVRIMDPQSSKRSISNDSKRVLLMFQSWLKYSSPILDESQTPMYRGSSGRCVCRQRQMPDRRFSQILQWRHQDGPDGSGRFKSPGHGICKFIGISWDMRYIGVSMNHGCE